MAQSTTDPNLFTWTEIYADEAAMFAHLEHCGAADLAPKMAILPELCSEPLAVEASGPLTAEAKEALAGWGAKMGVDTGVGFGAGCLGRRRL